MSDLIDKNNQIQIKLDKDKKKTFLSYKKTDILKELKNSLNYSNLDKCIYWSIVLDFSGYYKDLLFFFIDYYLERINISNPKFPILLVNIYERYSNIIEKTKETYNSQELRNHLVFMVTNLSLSSKTDLPKLVKFPKKQDINIIEFKDRILSKSTENIDKIISYKDDRQIIIPLNEIDNGLRKKEHQTGSYLEHIIFWLSWITEFESRNNLPICDIRPIRDIDNKYCTDVTWLIWKIIFNNTSDDKLSIINKLFSLYKLDYTKGKKKKKTIFFIYSFILIINKVPSIDFSKPIIVDLENSIKTSLNVNLIYNQISSLNNSRDKKLKKKLYIPVVNN